MQNEPIREYIKNIFSIIGLLLFFEIISKKQFLNAILLDVLYVIASCYIVLTFISTLLERPLFCSDDNTFLTTNFLGGDNYSGFILIVLCGCLFLRDLYISQSIRFRTWFISIIGFLCLLLPFSVSAFVSYGLMLFFIYIFLYSNSTLFLKLFFNWKIALLVCFFVVVSVSFFNIDSILSDFLYGINKTGFNGRNMIWPSAITLIEEHLFLGYGGLDYFLSIKAYILSGANHTHNILLEFPFITGFLGCFFWGIYIFLLFRRCNEFNSCVKLFFIVLTAYLYCSIFDFYIGLIWFYLLFDLFFIINSSFPHGNLQQN